jgi:hypothetical protein
MAKDKSRGKAVSKVSRQKRPKPKVLASSIEQRPDQLNHFCLWLRNGARLVGQFADHREAMSLASRFEMPLEPEMVRDITRFLAALSASLDAGREALNEIGVDPEAHPKTTTPTARTL